MTSWADGSGAARMAVWLGALNALGCVGPASLPDAGEALDAGGLDAPSPDTGLLGGPDTRIDAPDVGSAALRLPPENGGLDYQLGGAYPPPAGVTIVARDRTEGPAPGLFNICYLNGFQAQPGDEAFWMTNHPEVLLRDGAGDLVIDPDWTEILFDTRTDANRATLADVVGGWIAGCRDDGFDAIEIDNLDSFTRSGGLLTENDAVLTIRGFADVAHALGMAIAQKNAVELVPRRVEMGTDFVVAEECNAWSECDGYIAGYGAHVLMIEYERTPFDAGCAAYPDHSIVLRDLDLVTPGVPSYLREGC